MIDTSPSLDMATVERYAELKDRKRALEEEIQAIRDELATLEPKLLDAYAEQGVQSIKTRTGYTVYLRGQWWARPREGDYARACEALRDAGLEGMIHETFNIQTLSSWVRELKKEDPSAELPPSFDDAIDVQHVFNLLARKS